MTQAPKHKHVDYLVTGDHSPDSQLDVNSLKRFPTHDTFVNSKSIKILSNNMQSIHKIYEHGSIICIVMKELFDIIISEKSAYTEEMIK